MMIIIIRVRCFCIWISPWCIPEWYVWCWGSCCLSARVTWPERSKGAKDEVERPKGLSAWMVPTLLHSIQNPSTTLLHTRMWLVVIKGSMGRAGLLRSTNYQLDLLNFEKWYWLSFSLARWALNTENAAHLQPEDSLCIPIKAFRLEIELAFGIWWYFECSTLPRSQVALKFELSKTQVAQ